MSLRMSTEQPSSSPQAALEQHSRASTEQCERSVLEAYLEEKWPTNSDSDSRGGVTMTSRKATKPRKEKHTGGGGGTTAREPNQEEEATPDWKAESAYT